MESKKLKILVIDDIQDNIVSIKALIKDIFPDARTLTALNGSKGINLANEEDPDVILLDIVMPGMDGYEVCKKLKANDNLKDIPVIFVTALKDDSDNRIQAWESGAEAFLSKPIDRIELTAQIRAMVKIRAANRNKCNEKEQLAQLVSKRTKELEKSQIRTLKVLEDLRAEIEVSKQAEEERKKLVHNLGERVKELNCFYALAKIIEKPGITLDRIIEEAVNIIPPAYQFPETTCVRIILEKHEFESDNFLETKWKQSANITIQREIVGEVTVCYLEEKPEFDEGSFLKEERELIEAIALRLGRISERYLAEEALQENEEKYRTLFERESDAIFIQDPATTLILDANEATSKMYGYDRDELIGMSCLEFSAEVEDSISAMNQITQGGGIKIPIRYHKKKDGSVFPVDISAYEISLSGKKAIFAVSKDISERIQAQNELLKSKQFQDILLDNLPVITLILKKETREIVACNKLAKESGAIVGKTCHDTLNNCDKNCPFCLAPRLWETGKPQIVEAENIGRFWEGRWIDFTDDLYIHYIYDITDKKNAENDLKEALEKAQESDRLKSAFLANMSHEIRTPMNGILGFTELLKEGGLDKEDQEKYINIIEGSGQRLLNIINDLIDISKLEADQMIISISEVIVHEEIETIIDFFKPEIERKGLRFICHEEKSESPKSIKTDREKLTAIFTNLLKNAIKFTYEGYIELGYQVKDEYFEFFVKDTGIGIPKDYHLTIFDRFIKEHHELSRVYEGSGLGLSIAKSYVELLGGKIWLESEKGKGSVFYFTIPYDLYDENEETIVDQVAITTTHGHSKNLSILIVEDEETIDHYLTILARKIGREIHHAETGLEAVEMCRKNMDIDLVLMDIRMPEMGGYEATRLIRKFNKDVVIIAQTAYALDGDREKAIEAGCNDYLTKPINRDVFFDIIDKNMRKKKSNQFGKYRTC